MLIAAPTQQITDRYAAVRALTEQLAAPLSAEDQTPQSMPDASPVKWHRAHTTWFFEEFLLRQRRDYTEFDPTYRYLFNSYYETVGPRHPRTSRGLVTRPGTRCPPQPVGAAPRAVSHSPTMVANRIGL